MVDISAIDDVSVGTPVVVLGRDGGDTISAVDLAHWAQTNPYEILCGISKRVPRVLARSEADPRMPRLETR